MSISKQEYQSFLHSLGTQRPSNETYTDFLASLKANRPMTEAEFVENQKRNDARSKWEATGAFTENAFSAVGSFFSGAKDWALDESVPFAKALWRGEAEAKKAVKYSGKFGWRNTKDFIKDVKGALEDEMGGYDQPTEWKREYHRYLRNYKQMEYRDLVTKTSPYKKTIGIGQFVADPLNLAPVGFVFGPTGKLVRSAVRKGVKGAAKVSAPMVGALGTGALATQKVVGFPRRGIQKVAEVVGLSKGLSKVAPYAAGASGLGIVPTAVISGLEKGLGAVSKTATGLSPVLKVLSTPSGQTRFLSRLAADKTVSPRMRSWAARADKYKGTQIGDYMFNVVADGVSAGAIMSAFNAAAGHHSAEELGQSFGTGFAMGGTLFAPFGTSGAGKTLAGVNQRGEMTARSKITVSDYMENKLSNEQAEKQKKLPPSLQVAIATNDAVGTNGINVEVMPPDDLLALLNEDIKAKNEVLAAEGKELRELAEQAPKGWADRQTRTIFLNEKTIGGASKEAFEMFLHEIGHIELHDFIQRDPMVLEMMLDEYRDPKGETFYIYDHNGHPIREVKLSKEMVNVWKDYNSIQKGIDLGRDATALMHEVFADQYAMAFSKDPNVINALHPTLKSSFYHAMRRTLAGLGLIDARTGNFLTNTISKQLKKNPTIIDFIKRYKLAKSNYYEMRSQLLEEGLVIDATKTNQTANEAYIERFGGVAMTNKESTQLVAKGRDETGEINNAIKEAEIEKEQVLQERDDAEITFAKASRDRIDAENASADNAVIEAAIRAEKIAKEKLDASERKLKRTDFVGLGKGKEGRSISPRMRNFFTRGNDDGRVAQVIDFLQRAIYQRFSIGFGYRSGKRLDRYNKFHWRNITLWGWQISPKTGHKYRSLKVVGWNNAKVIENIQTMIDEGFIQGKEVDSYIKEIEEASHRALKDPEGRINPLGGDKNLKENEVMTAILGMDVITKGAAEEVFKNKRLADFFAEQNNLKDNQRRLKRAFVSYDVEALAGASATGKRGLGFDYRNTKLNYMPDMPAGKDETVPLPFIDDLADKDPAAGYYRVVTEKMGKQELDKFMEPMSKGEMQQAMGSTSQVQPFQPRFPKKNFMPAGETLGVRDNISDIVLPKIKQAKLSPQQLQAALAKTAGAKTYADEIGLTDFVKDRKSVTKDEVEAYVRENSPQLEVEVLSLSGKINRDSKYAIPEVLRIVEGHQGMVDDAAHLTLSNDGNAYRALMERFPELRKLGEDGGDWAQVVLEDVTGTMGNVEGAPKFSEYQEPGGTNYREIVVRTDPYRIYGTHADPTHFGDNVLLWLRMNERVDADGKKVLFIEELQSNLHQQGRKEGYQDDAFLKRTKRIDWEMRRLGAENSKIIEDRRATGIPFEPKERKIKGSEAYKLDANEKKIQKLLAERTDIHKHRSAEGLDRAVPDAPFKKNWPALGMKLAIKEAIEGGYDRVAWLDGQGQAERYDLSRQISRIEYSKGSFEGEFRSELRAYDHDGALHLNKNGVTPEQLPDYIGKEVAKKLMEQKPETGNLLKAREVIDKYRFGHTLAEYRHISGLDLKVGGEGMKAFYDREMRSIASKISKKIKGGKVTREKPDHPKRPWSASVGGEVVSSGVEKSTKGRHFFDVPKDPAALDNLTLYMPAAKAPADTGAPLILKERGRGKLFMPAESSDVSKYENMANALSEIKGLRSTEELLYGGLAGKAGWTPLSINRLDKSTQDLILQGRNQGTSPARVSDVLKSMSENGSGDEVKALSTALRNALTDREDKKVQVQFLNEESWNKGVELRGKEEGWSETEIEAFKQGIQGGYDIKKDRIVLRQDADEGTTIHEILHGVTSRKIAPWVPEGGQAGVDWMLSKHRLNHEKYIKEIHKLSKNSKAPASIRNLAKAFKRTSDYLQKEFGYGADPFYGPSKKPLNKYTLDPALPPYEGEARGLYGMMNLDEFITAAFSDSDFQRILRKIPWDDKRTTWEILIDAVWSLLTRGKQLLGESTKETRQIPFEARIGEGQGFEALGLGQGWDTAGKATSKRGSGGAAIWRSSTLLESVLRDSANLISQRRPAADLTVTKARQRSMDGPPLKGMLRVVDAKLRTAKLAKDIEGDTVNPDKLFMPAAYHGTPHTFKAEEGAPMGRFRSSQIGTGEGAQAFGHGLYFASKMQVADHYRKTLGGRMAYEPEVMERHGKRLEELQQEARWRNDAVMEMLNKSETTPETIEAFKKRRDDAEEVLFAHMALMRKEGGKYQEGSLYKVELAPKENEYLYWDKPLSEQPKGVREKLGINSPKAQRYLEIQSKIDDLLLEGLNTDKVVLDTPEWKSLVWEARGLRGKDELGFAPTMVGKEYYQTLVKRKGSQPAASAALLEAGIPGIKYLEGASRAKGEGDYNYVIFDEGAVTITDKLFMPAEQAGAPKGKNVEAARLWEKKGVKSPYFKKWFGKSKVVDEKGDPLVVSHGTWNDFSVHNREWAAEHAGGEQRKNFDTVGLWFTPVREQALLYGPIIKKSFLNIRKPLELSWEGKSVLESFKQKFKTEKQMVEEFEATDIHFSKQLIAKKYGWGEGMPTPYERKVLDEYPAKQKEFLENANKEKVNARESDPLMRFRKIVEEKGGADGFRKWAKSKGYDGVHLHQTISDTTADRFIPADMWIAFEPTQIKSATGNRGTFDPADPNIMHMPAMDYEKFIIDVRDSKRGISRSGQIGGFDTAFHFASKFRDVISAIGNFDEKIWKQREKLGYGGLEARAKSFSISGKDAKKIEMFLLQQFADLIESLPQRKGTNLQTGELVDPFFVVRRNLNVAGEKGDVSTILKNISDAVTTIPKKETNFNVHTQVYNLMELSEFMGVKVNESVANLLADREGMKGTHSESQRENAQALMEMAHPEYYDVRKLKGGSVLATKIPTPPPR